MLKKNTFDFSEPALTLIGRFILEFSWNPQLEDGTQLLVKIKSITYHHVFGKSIVCVF